VIVAKMNFNNKKEAIDFLETVEISVSSEDDILIPKKKLFEDDVHDAIDYLIDECGFGIKYI
jgi:hypothetical protein